MAENQLKTTSSRGCNEKIAHILVPHNVSVRKTDQEQVIKSKQSFQSATRHENKLKRKKKLSASLTSVGDTVNQEKRTRIEGIHLNIVSRSKDSNNRTHETATTRSLDSAAIKPPATKSNSKVERPVIIGGVNVLSVAPQRFKRKLQENVDTIQKLNALADQLRLEVNELKSNLITERVAVRSLRAQNDADSRKWRNEVKKLQQTLDSAKKSNLNGAKKPNELTVETNSHVATDGLINYEIQRLTNEIAVLREANKTKEEKTLIFGQADRRKAVDMRHLKTAYENRLTQIQKSAKIEITRLLEEIKTKERNIGQLKKDMQKLQTGKKHAEAKTKPKSNESNQMLKKPITKTTLTTQTINEIVDTTYTPLSPEHQAQVSTEITQLKNIELINNSKNVHKSSLEIRTSIKQQIQQQHEQKMNHEHMRIGESTDRTTWMETLLTNTAATKPTLPEYRTKDNNSDTDSALSSAPPSISPQPPSSGADSGVMWQALQDLDKLQKEVEIYQRENERLQTELQLMKQELLVAENAALAAKKNTYINELLQRVKDMEDQQVLLSTEANELREQNELLEFRILELEDDKMDGTCEDHCQRLQNILKKNTRFLVDKDKHCLQQLLLCVQQLDLDAMADQESWQSPTKSEPRARHSRIVATVQPYSNSATPSAPSTPSKQQQHQPRNSISSWQNSSLSESGVFVECDLFSTQTETEREPHPHLQYYQERLLQLEGKILVYESSGETQAKHLAERLQRELQLNKQVKELIERVELLVAENALLDEAKCEFEEAENDTRFHLQRNEEELEILRQRNVELEFSKDALGAKYRDCRAECLILREDLCAAETQLEHLQAERQQAKQQLESLRRSLPLLLICRILTLARTSAISMGNELCTPRTAAGSDCGQTDRGSMNAIIKLKDEVKCLRNSLKELNSRHYEAMETADSHWVDMESEYKAREDAYRTKEVSLKQKINKLQDILRDDSRAAAEKIQQLEETEHGLQTCLVRVTKEHRDLVEQYRALEFQTESRNTEEKLAMNQLQPITEELEKEKRRSQTLSDDLAYSKKLQQSMEEQLKAETDALRNQIYDLKKELLNIEVTNGELKEEVGTLEAKIAEMERQLMAGRERMCCLEDELRTKDELCQSMERKLGVCPEAYCLADELYDNPDKRAKRDEIRDLESASQGLGCALRDLERRERELPTHKDFQTIACSVKQLADTILSVQKPIEVGECDCDAAGEKQITICQNNWPDDKEDKGGKDGADKGAGTPPDVSKDTDPVTSNKEEERTSGGTAGVSSSPRTAGGGLAISAAEAEVESICHGVSLIGQQLKKQLAEMPTVLCRFVYGDQSEQTVSEVASKQVEPQKQHEPHKQVALRKAVVPRKQVKDKHLIRKRQVCKLFVQRRIFRCRLKPCGAKNYPFKMRLHRFKSTASFHSAASIHSVHSIDIQDSMRSQYAQIIEPLWEHLQLDGISQTDPVTSQCQLVQVAPQMCDEELQTQCSTQDCGTQAENVGVEQRLMLLSVRTRGFLEMLQQSINETEDFGVETFRARVLQLWEANEEFREHIDLLQDLCEDQSHSQELSNKLESYDIFVAVLSCVRALKLALKPCHSNLLQHLEDRINERLINYHNQKMESEFYCTIYYPVERRNPIIFGE